MNRWTVLRLDGSTVVANVSLAVAFARMRGELAGDSRARFTMRARGAR